MTGRLRGDAGSASLELVAFLPAVLIAALAAVQLYAAAWTATQTTTAARAAARAASLDVDPEAAARNALTGALRDDLTVEQAGDGWRVSVEIPLLFSRISAEQATVRRFAAFPDSEVTP